jgi:uncharacterized membrane protein HdeD (DUF308 family)
MDLGKLETKLDEALDKKAPVKLPPNARKAIATNLWWITLLAGIFELWAAYALWHLGHWADRLVDYANTISAYYGGPAVTTNHLGVFYYLTVIGIAAVAVIFLLATPALKNMKKSGWNLLFYAFLIDVVVAVVRLFSNVGGGFFNFIWTAIEVVIGAFFLFQVREYFLGTKVAAAPAAPAEHPAHAEKHEDKKE